MSQSEENVVKETENFCKVLNGINFSVGCVESLLWANDKTAKLLSAYQSDRTNECNRQLELNASKLNMCVQPNERDGNCLFRAMAVNLMTRTSDPDINKKLMDLKIDCSCTDTMAYGLRQSAVTEIEQKSSFYSNFFENMEQLNISEYRNDGKFEGAMGDAMITSLSNALQIPILIVTARPDIEVILIECKQSISGTPICVAYNHEGPGHYDALSSKTIETSPVEHCGSHRNNIKKE